MPDFFSGLLFLIEALKILKDDQEKIKKQKEKLVGFLVDLSMAINLTRDQISKNGYKRSPKLHKVWLDLFKKSYVLELSNNQIFPDWFESKASFWNTPDRYFSGGSTMESIKTLEELQQIIFLLKKELGLDEGNW